MTTDCSPNSTPMNSVCLSLGCNIVLCLFLFSSCIALRSLPSQEAEPPGKDVTRQDRCAAKNVSCSVVNCYSHCIGSGSLCLLLFRWLFCLLCYTRAEVRTMSPFVWEPFFSVMMAWLLAEYHVLGIWRVDKSVSWVLPGVIQVFGMRETCLCYVVPFCCYPYICCHRSLFALFTLSFFFSFFLSVCNTWNARHVLYSPKGLTWLVCFVVLTFNLENTSHS